MLFLTESLPLILSVVNLRVYLDRWLLQCFLLMLFVQHCSSLDINVLDVLKFNNTPSDSNLGYESVSTSGDTIVVGNTWDDNAGTDSGAAYVFVRDGTTYIQQVSLTGSNTEEGDNLGYSVSISGDTIVVGAIGEDSNATGVDGTQSDTQDNGATSSGAVYVFVRDGTSWTQQAYLKASNTGAYDGFGYSVSISEDTIVVGAVYEDSNATGVNGMQDNGNADGSGAAYVFVRDGISWTQQAYLKASNTGVGDHFGCSVSISGDTIVVGAHLEDSSATGANGNQTDNSTEDSGAAYVFVRNGTMWAQQAYLKASNTGADDYFGRSVSISGDTIVVGAYGEDSNATGVDGTQSNGASQSGAAYVFVRDGSIWTQQAYLKASNTQNGDCFGMSVSISGDTIVVGAYWEDSNATGVNGTQIDNSISNSGAAYVFVRDDSTWAQRAYLKANVTSSGAQFGRAVTIDKFIVVSENNAVTIFGNMMEITAGTTATTATMATTGTTATTRTTTTTVTTATTAATETIATTGTTGIKDITTTTSITKTTEVIGTTGTTGNIQNELYEFGLTSNIISKNSLNGTVVGSFIVYDKNYDKYSDYIFNLVVGEGSKDNSKFLISNGVPNKLITNTEIIKMGQLIVKFYYQS